MNQDKLNEIVCLRGLWLRGEDGGLRADLRDANLSRADLSGALSGPAYYSISWSGHGEMGRRLHAVEQNGELVFSCGCFSGSEDDLLEYIEQGDKLHAESRLRALEIILELHKAGK